MGASRHSRQKISGVSKSESAYHGETFGAGLAKRAVIESPAHDEMPTPRSPSSGQRVNGTCDAVQHFRRMADRGGATLDDAMGKSCDVP